MKLHVIAAIALVVLVATAGVAVAAPGNAPDNPGEADDEHGASDDAPDGEPAEDQSIDEDDVNRSENASATADRGVEMSENESAADGDVSAVHAQGSGEDLPAQVPDHVSQIHDLIRQFFDGELAGSLGEAISGVTASDDASENTADAST